MSASACLYCGQVLAFPEGEESCPACRRHAAAENVSNDALAMGRSEGKPLANKLPETVDQRGDFQTTHWSLLFMAAQTESPLARAALETLCGMYWYPVYAFIRRRGYGAEQAKDFTQDLFYHLIEKRSLAMVDPNRGRFRSFLRTCAQNLINQHWQREHALKRGGNQSPISFDEVLAESRYASEQAGSLSPDELFERRWALSLLDQTMERLKREYAGTGRAAYFEALHPFLSGAKEASITYAEVAARLGQSECAVRQAAHRLRGRFGELLYLEVAQTITNPADLEDEIGHLRTVLSR